MGPYLELVYNEFMRIPNKGPILRDRKIFFGALESQEKLSGTFGLQVPMLKTACGQRRQFGFQLACMLSLSPVSCLPNMEDTRDY